MELNHWIELVDKDHARYYACYLTHSGPFGRETRPRIVAAGQSLDEMERAGGKWRLRRGTSLQRMRPGELVHPDYVS